VERYTNQLRDEFGLEIVDSIESLCTKVDGILLESVDGRPHLEQVKPVLAAKKPVFVDKPMGGNLADVIEIFRLAKQAGVPCWSSSSYRYSPGVVEAIGGKVGKILGCVAFGACYHEPHHPDLYWYGIHTAETIYALMGPGCVSVTRTSGPDSDVVVGKWKDGRIGVFRGGRKGANNTSLKAGYVVFGEKGVVHGEHASYDGLLKEIVLFFKTGKVPVEPAETIELFAFMSAADESKKLDGATVTLKSLIDEASKNK
jgi:predicted dehydrogenase